MAVRVKRASREDPNIVLEQIAQRAYELYEHAVERTATT